MSEEITAPLPCLGCGRELEGVFSDLAPLQPSGGTMFKSRGNYGSTVWDPGVSSRDYLLINMCDQCLTAATAQGRVARVTEVPARPEMQVRRFDPQEDLRRYEATVAAIEAARGDGVFQGRLRRDRERLGRSEAAERVQADQAASDRFWLFWSQDRMDLVGGTSGRYATADEALRNVTDGEGDYVWARDHWFVEEVDESRFDWVTGEWDQWGERTRAQYRPDPPLDSAN